MTLSSWILIVLASGLSGYLYYMGGRNVNKRPYFLRWKPRDFGCTLVTMVGMFVIYGNIFPWWTHLIAFGALFGFLTTYWDFAFKNVDNFWMHGLMCGLAYFPYAIITGNWLALVVRCVVVAILMGVISASSEDVVVEEVGRGSVLPLTLPLLLI